MSHVFSQITGSRMIHSL